MILIPLEIESASASIEVKWEQAGTDRRTISFSVRLSRTGEIRLATGETFCHPERRASERKKGARRIEAAHFIVHGDAAHKWEMHYVPSYNDDHGEVPSTIEIHVFLTNHEFSELLANLRVGVGPTRVTLDAAESDALKYGWEPDGSAKEWDNRGRAPIQITSFEFDYEFPDASRDRREAAQSISDQMDSLRRQMRNAAWFLAVGFVVLLLVAARRF